MAFLSLSAYVYDPTYIGPQTKKSAYVYDPTYIGPYQLGREQHRALKYGLGKKKNNINIYSKNFKTILAFNTPIVIPWGQTHARTHARMDQYFLNTDMSIYRKMQNRVNLGLKRRIFVSKTHMSLRFYVFGNAPLTH